MESKVLKVVYHRELPDWRHFHDPKCGEAFYTFYTDGTYRYSTWPASDTPSRWCLDDVNETFCFAHVNHADFTFDQFKGKPAPYSRVLYRILSAELAVQRMLGETI